jgi:hypothetical protein
MCYLISSTIKFTGVTGTKKIYLTVRLINRISVPVSLKIGIQVKLAFPVTKPMGYIYTIMKLGNVPCF